MRATKKSNLKKAAKKHPANRPNPVVHFEMPVQDRRRAAKFYTQAFGWDMKMLGEEMGSYMLATTAPTDKEGMLKEPGMINGGFFPVKSDMPAQYPSVVIAVDNIKHAMRDIKKAGGEVIGEPMEIPGHGVYVSFFDTEHNRVSIIEPTMEMKRK